MKFSYFLIHFFILISFSIQLNIKISTQLSATQPSVSNLQSISECLQQMKDGTTQETFLNQFKFALYHMTKGEAVEIFNFMDKTHKGIISQEDAKDFSNLFLKPFEDCDSKKENYLEKVDLEKCVQNEPTFSLIEITSDIKDKFYDTLLDLLTYNNFEGKVNFYSYLMLRKAMFSWNKCSSDKRYLSITSFKCAFTLVNGNGYIETVPLETIYDYVIKRNLQSNMHFLDFVDILTSLNAFQIFGFRRDRFELDKNDFENAALKEDKIINNFNSYDINFMYDILGLHSMNFLTFHFFFSKYRLFNIFSKNNDYLPIDDALKSIDHIAFPAKLRYFIDKSLTNFKADEYKLNNILPKDVRYGEMKYYFSFKEKSEIQNQIPLQANQDARKVFFTMHCSSNPCIEISKVEYFKAFVYSSLFETMSQGLVDELDVKYIMANLDKTYDINIPTFGGHYRFGMEIIRKLPLNLSIDLILFNSIESLNDKIKNKDNLLEFDLSVLISDSYGMKELPREVFTKATSENTKDSKIKQLIDIFTIQGKCAERKRHPEATSRSEKIKNKE